MKHILLFALGCLCLNGLSAFAQDPQPLPPDEAIEALQTFEDLEVELVLSEPEISQPVFFNFDERGRMWVVQYLQYPYPAGLKVLSQDQYYRTVFDKVPPPPPHHDRGRDVISIHEDSDGDGKFDKHKVFLDGLNIVTAVERGRGGVWILNPPYLLFYPDANNDDVPDGDPEVHLEGFGLQDTHSCVNSLRWGPDGWLYAAQGSTVTANVKKPGEEGSGVFSMGQLIWRYHPESRTYEIFAEGGGNAFGVEFDRSGRVYSGHNGGNTRGFHYVQGGYYQKGFSKHGPLSNPFSFGYFPQMKHAEVPRFTHNFVIYEAENLPEKYRGHLFGIEPLQGRLVEATITPHGSSYQTEDLGHPIVSKDPMFRPVDVKVGPDGAIYFADMYEQFISHREHYSGRIDREHGRIYRLQRKDAPPLPAFDLGSQSTKELIATLQHPNKWFRQTALRLLGDRKDASAIPELLDYLKQEKEGQRSLETLWALNLCGGFNEEAALELLHHPDPMVRLWTVRLLGDQKKVSPEVALPLAELAVEEPHLQVRSQLASTARRLPAESGLPIIKELLRRDEDASDIHLPLLLWWGLEIACGEEPEAVIELFSETQLWSEPIVQETILPRLMRRFAQTGQRKDLLICAQFFAMSPNEASTKKLMTGFEEAFQGRPLGALPTALLEQLQQAGGGSLELQIRLGKDEAITRALEAIQNPQTPEQQQISLIQTLGEVVEPQAAEVILKLLATSNSNPVRIALLTAIQRYSLPEIGLKVLALYSKFPPEVQAVAQSLLVSRQDWTRDFVKAAAAGQIDPKTVPEDTVRKMTIYQDEEIVSAVRNLWGDVQGATSEEMQRQIESLLPVVGTGSADPFHGKELFQKTCLKCHMLFNEGGRIGPDLTAYKRDDLRNMLINIINPSVEIREGFESYVVITSDGLALTGFLMDQDNQVVVLRSSEGQTHTIQKEEIEEMLPQKKSLMPEGLLKDFSEQDVRDLFSYLRSSQPLNR